MKEKIITRMGDGRRVELPAEKIKQDILAGTQDAADRGKIPELSPDELEHLFEIFADPNRIVAVAPGEEVVTTDDSASLTLIGDQPDGGVGLPLSRLQSILAYERTCCADTAGIGHHDYSCKPIKPIINYEKQAYYSISQVATIPLIYGTQPNLGLYFRQDGPYPNPSELLPSGKINEAMAAQEEAAEHLKNDLIFIGKSLYEVGCDGFNFDTSASAGDADFLAALQAIRELKKIAPKMAIELGMSSEFVLGMHGGITFDGVRLAGLYPHDQVKTAEAAGADIFGPAINVKATKSTPWNLARAVTFVKETVRVADIPVHPNVGMGVCGLPMYEAPPIDCVTRASKALVQIGKADGLQLGVGDPFGMSVAHIMSAGMGGMRTAGDLVAWMQLTRKMKITEAKKYVAQRLGIDVVELTDEEVMHQVRQDLDICTLPTIADGASGIVAKYRIAELLDIEINSVDIFKSKLDLSGLSESVARR